MELSTKICPQCSEHFVRSDSGWRHADGRVRCHLRDAVVDWLKIGGWGVALIVGLLLIVGFLSTFAAPIISNSN